MTDDSYFLFFRDRPFIKNVTKAIWQSKEVRVVGHSVLKTLGRIIHTVLSAPTTFQIKCLEMINNYYINYYQR